MAPQETRSQRTSSEDEEDYDEQGGEQYLYIIRHGDRWDYENPSWSSSRPGDPPLSPLGHQQARQTGIFLHKLLQQDGIAPRDITWLSSPFVRCLQTSTDMLNAMPGMEQIRILPEYSVFEWDGKGKGWHASLPPLEERRHYFPRLDLDHSSLFVPSLPEPTPYVFQRRCQRVMTELSQRYCDNTRRTQNSAALVIVTHAAACIGLCQAATTGLGTADIHPAAPCGLYRLTRSGGSSTDDSKDTHDTWTLDPCDRPHGFNGYTAHVADLLTGPTRAWNHFGDKRIHRGYTGPRTSIFAPPELETDG